MDSWSHDQVLSLLEGGNGQLEDFFVRHGLGRGGNVLVEDRRRRTVQQWEEEKRCRVVDRRYETKAALFYRENLAVHVEKVGSQHRYKGRDASRRRRTTKTTKTTKRRDGRQERDLSSSSSCEITGRHGTNRVMMAEDGSLMNDGIRRRQIRVNG